MKLVIACCLAFAAAPLLAQPPAVEKVEPPDWWASSTVNPVRLLVRGRHLAGAQLDCPRLACANVRVNDAGTYLFADVAIPPDAAPGPYPLAVRTAGGSATIPFAVAAPLDPAGRFGGFGPDDVFYLLMPDRFANADTTNDDPAASPGLLDRARGRHYHGGDLAGVRARLPYLKELGITTLWMNPIYDNTNVLDDRERWQEQPTTAFHGYHAIDFYGVEERLGDMAELRRLVDEAHAHGIKVVLDMVANHTSAYHPWVSDPPTPTWYNGTPERHLANTWQTWTLADPYSPPHMRRETLDGWFIDILPDLDQDDPEVARYVIQNTLWWVGTTGIDGIRQDTWPYVPRTFWRDWMTAIEREHPTVRVVGEVFDGDPALVAFFEGGRPQFDGVDTRLHALFDFPLFYPLRNAFARGRSVREVPQMLARDRLYRDPDAMITFLGLHDVSRFMHEPGATIDGLRLAYTVLFTVRGTPLVYYGDEIALPGGDDPDNRRDFPGGWPGDARDAFTAAGRTADEQAVWSHVQALARLRAARPELRRGATENLHVAEQQWVYRRGRSVVAINNDTTGAEVRLPADGLALPAAALGGCPAPRADGDAVVLALPARTGCVY